MFKPENLLARETWTFVLSKLSIKDKLSCRCVCNPFKKEVDSILTNQDRLWLRHRDDDYAHYFCYDKDHRICSRDTLYFGRTISIKNLKFVSALMPSLKILHFDPLDQVYREDYDEGYDHLYDARLPDYRSKNDNAVRITKIFPQVTCLILPGRVEKKNFVGNLSQVKHITLFDFQHERSHFTFRNLDSLEVRKFGNLFIRYKGIPPMPSKRFVVPDARIKWSNLPKTLEVIETKLNCDEYISLGKPYFSNLKTLKGYFPKEDNLNQNPETVVNFLKDHKESVTELYFSPERDAVNIKVLLPLLTSLQKLSVEIETDKQAIELKEIKALAHNLQYFELSFYLWSKNGENLGSILENLPTGLDNLLIEYGLCTREIITFMEKIMEKVVNGNTKTVTIAGISIMRWFGPGDLFQKIIEMTPEPVKVEKRNERVDEDINLDKGPRTEATYDVYDIVISL